MQEVYLDNSSTTRPLPEVIAEMKKALNVNYGNPSSLHNKGLQAERYLKKARNLIAEKLGVSNKEIIFTSGGTESNNLAIKGTVSNYQNRGNHIITGGIEHASVYNVFKNLENSGFKVTYLSVDKTGLYNLGQLEKSLNPETIMVSLMHVNNELGTIEPVVEAAEIIKKFNEKIFFHVDAVQSFGKVFLKNKISLIDLLSISAHKFHGPKGIGALYLNKNMNIKPLFAGGGQEQNLRSGTENTPAIAGMIAALENLPDLNNKRENDKKIKQLSNQLREGLLSFNNIKINTPFQAAPHILNISFPGIKGEVLVHALEEKGIYTSTGSACHSRKEDKSRVLRALKIPQKYIEGTIRISLSRYNTHEDIEYTLSQLKEQLSYLQI